ncbi:MAG: RNA methyltransferase [Deltaproteobacteria bacterium]|nr:RNA methyltransferase [Deltaproteobacteria bacterium]
MNQETKDKIQQLSRNEQNSIIEKLNVFLEPGRLERFQEVITKRTRQISVVLEDLYQPHNASAAVRSCDCFGIQNLDVVEDKKRFKPAKGISMGAGNWLSIKKHKSTANCFSDLKNRGYQILATTLGPHSQDINHINTEQPLAIVFGTEKDGLSQEAHQQADTLVQLPMFGFSQSFNVSVSVALCLQILTSKLRQKPEVQWQLSQEEQTTLLLEWCVKSIRAGEKIFTDLIAN